MPTFKKLTRTVTIMIGGVTMFVALTAGSAEALSQLGGPAVDSQGARNSNNFDYYFNQCNAGRVIRANMASRLQFSTTSPDGRLAYARPVFHRWESVNGQNQWVRRVTGTWQRMVSFVPLGSGGWSSPTRYSDDQNYTMPYSGYWTVTIETDLYSGGFDNNSTYLGRWTTWADAATDYSGTYRNGGTCHYR